MKNHRITAAIVAATLGVGGALAVPLAALADDPPPIDDTTIVEPAPEVEPVVDEQPPAEQPEAARVAPQTVVQDPTPYVLVAWVVGDLGDIWAVPQTFHVSTDLEAGDLNALDSQLVGTCGVDYQVDLYYDNATTASLIAGGVLYGPSNPPEALAYGAVKGDPWKFVDNADCPPPVVETCTNYTQVHTTDLSTWSWADTRATGHYALTLNGLHIWTEGATSTDKVAGYYATSFPLAHLGTETIAQSIDYTAAFGLTPGLQLVLDADDDGTADGILVGEAVYGNAWWLSNSAAQFVKDGAPNTGGGYGSSWYGTPDEWLGAFPTARILAVGFSLGSGVHGDGVLNSITLGCVQYTFGLPVPQIPEPRVVVTYGEFGGDEPTCETPTVTWTRTATTTTTPWKVVVVDGAYQVVEDTENATSVTVTDEQTEVHEYDGDCTPPPTEPPASTPPVVELGHTGVSAAETLFLVLAGIALLALGAVALLAARIRRQQ